MSPRVTVEIIGTDDVIAKLRNLIRNTQPRDAVVVGYTAKAALYVHERREMALAGLPRSSGIGVYWGPKGRAGFLLDVAKEMKGTLRQIILEAATRGVPLVRAILMAGLRLQRESQANVPVEYGNLKASAFTRIES